MQGYQITQLSQPIASHGHLDVVVPRTWKRSKGAVVDAEARRVRVCRIQLEQDSGKSVHTLREGASCVDLNRAGVGLLEIVTEPDVRSAAEAGEFLKSLQRLLRHVGTCDGNMEDGSLRCDVNVSVHEPGAAFGQRVEVKNLNSIKSVMKAIEHEYQRQVVALETGGSIAQETRTFDALTGVTVRLRDKEDKLDYRFMPDPDLLPLVLSDGLLSAVRASLTELPSATQARLQTQYTLSLYDASMLVAETGVAALFEEVRRVFPSCCRACVLTAACRAPCCRLCASLQPWMAPRHHLSLLKQPATS